MLEARQGKGQGRGIGQTTGDQQGISRGSVGDRQGIGAVESVAGLEGSAG